MIKFFDIANQDKKYFNEIIFNLKSNIKKTDFILGKNVGKFEKKFSKLANVKYSIGCATGTDALILSIKALNLKKNHEVIIPGMSYISTGLGLSLNKTKISFADIDPDTGLISLESVKKKIKVNFNLEKIDFIEKEIIDSLGFLTLISHLEKKLNAEIDLSDKNPDNLTKAEKLANIIYKKLNK